MSETPAAFFQVREQFLTLVDDVRPELHRYCARLTGSVIEGEDIVQETMAKAFYTLSMMQEIPPLRPWLFRIAHNTAIDFLKSHGRKYTDPSDTLDELAAFEEQPDPLVVRAALAKFVALPVIQRSAVILKDVLGHSLEETAETMGTTVMAVKAALVRGRARLLAEEPRHEARAAKETERAALNRYAACFNSRDWDGLRSLIGEDCKLDLVSKNRRRGKEVGAYFGRYEKEDVALRVVELEGRLAFAAHLGGSEKAAYFILLSFKDGKVDSVRDFRYVKYITSEADFRPADSAEKKA